MTNQSIIQKQNTMKTLSIILILFISMGHSQTTVSNDNKYNEAMAKNIEIVYAAESLPSLQTAVNELERIGLAEKTKWEPYYYAAFGYVMMATQEQVAATKDAFLDQAARNISKASAMKTNDAEIMALEGFVHMIRISVDPESRGQQYSALGMQAFGKALSIDAANPRALALTAQMEFGTAQYLGSSTTAACATNDAALQKFVTFKSDNPLAPRWGRAMAEELKAKCK
jgi:hypothetical protein